MPKQLKRNTTKRKTQDPRDTFDFSTPNLRPQARPTDPYVRAFQDTKAKGITSIVRSINSSVKSYGDYQQSQQRANTVKAKADHLRGQERDKPKSFFNLGVGYDEAYNLIDGEARAIKLNDEYALAMKDNGFFADVKDKDKAREELWQSLYQKHFSGASDDDYTKAGAQDLIYRGKEKIDILAIEADYSLATQKFMNNVKTSQMDYIKHVGNDVQALRHGADLEWEKYRDYVSINPLLKERYLPDRTAFTKMYIDNMYQTADNIIDNPDTSLMEKEDQINNIFEALEMQGQDGISWTAKVGVNGKELFGADIRAKQFNFTRRIELLKKEEEEVKEEAQGAVYVDVMGAMVEATTPKERAIAYAMFEEQKHFMETSQAVAVMSYFSRNQTKVVEDAYFVATLGLSVQAGETDDLELLDEVGSQTIGITTYRRLKVDIDAIATMKKSNPKATRDYKEGYKRLKALLNPNTGMYRALDTTRLHRQQSILQEYFKAFYHDGKEPNSVLNRILIREGFDDVANPKMSATQRAFTNGVISEAEYKRRLEKMKVKEKKVPETVDLIPELPNEA